MKRLFLIVFSLVSFSFFVEATRACTCTEYDTPACAAYWRSDAVFAGQLQSITPVGRKSDQEMPTAMLHFIVEQPFRGVTSSLLEVATLSGTSCDMTFDVGKRYLIYASRETNGNQLFAGPCTRTTDLQHATEDLNYIRTVTQGEANESIAGRLAIEKYMPLGGVKVTATGSDQTIEATTNEKGDFSLSLPGPGKYKVRAFVPFGAVAMSYHDDPTFKQDATDVLTTIEYEVKIEKSNCDYRQIDVFKVDLHATAEVSGNVLTAAGRPVTPGRVYLVDASDPDRSESEKLEDNGSFKFQNVAIGEYFLVLNPRNEAPGETDAPYPQTYYPSAPEANAATKIVVTEGAKLENLTLRLGRPWKERVVSGKVIWQDGRRPENARISLYDGDRYVRILKVDEKGRFNFKVYGDFKYGIQAEIWGENHGRSERVLIKDKSNGVTLVLKPVG